MWWALAIVVLLLVMGDGDPLAGFQDVLAQITSGKRLTHATYGGDGVVNATPDDLAELAGASLDEYALARMVRSEEGNASNTVKAAIVWATLNYARRHDTTPAMLLLRAKNAGHAGYFGTQRDIDPESGNNGKSDRYASTALDPYQGDLDIVRAVMTGAIPDFTNGAIQYDAPPAFKSAERAAKVAADRIAEGRVQVFPEGIDPEAIRFWA